MISFSKTTVPARDRYRWKWIKASYIVYEKEQKQEQEQEQKQEQKPRGYTITFTGKNKRFSKCYQSIGKFVCDYAEEYSATEAINAMDSEAINAVNPMDRFGETEEEHLFMRSEHMRNYNTIRNELKAESAKEKCKNKKKSSTKKKKRAKSISTNLSTPMHKPNARCAATSTTHMRTRSRARFDQIPQFINDHEQKQNYEEESTQAVRVSPNKTTLSIKVKDLQALIGNRTEQKQIRMNITDEYGRCVSLHSREMALQMYGKMYDKVVEIAEQSDAHIKGICGTIQGTVKTQIKESVRNHVKDAVDDAFESNRNKEQKNAERRAKYHRKTNTNANAPHHKHEIRKHMNLSDISSRSSHWTSTVNKAQNRLFDVIGYDAESLTMFLSVITNRFAESVVPGLADNAKVEQYMTRKQTKESVALCHSNAKAAIDFYGLCRMKTSKTRHDEIKRFTEGRRD
eukprot:209857_1